MVKTFEMGTGAALDNAPEEGTQPNTNPKTTAGTDEFEKRFQAVCEYFDAVRYTEQPNDEGITSYELIAADDNPVAIGSLIELEGFVAQDILKKNV